MIRSVNIKTGYASRLPGLAERNFEFSPGLTVLWGQNASGKSSLLQIAAAYCSIKGGGWSRHFSCQEFDVKPIRGGEVKLPEGYSQLAPGKCEADVDWDGSPTLFFNAPAAQVRSSYFFDNEGQSHDGITSMDDQLRQIFGKPSSGQQTIGKLNRILQMADNPPSLDIKNPYLDCNSTWIRAWEIQHEYLMTLPAEGPMTILMDEPDSGLSIPNEFMFWRNVLPRLMDKGFQIIVATHSQMVPSLPLEFDVVEMTEGYWAECALTLKAIATEGVDHKILSPDHETVLRIIAENTETARKAAEEAEKKRKAQEEDQRRWEETKKRWEKE